MGLDAAQTGSSCSASIVIAGNIASGKTSLATRLAGLLPLELALEQVADNPYLDRFYADMRTWTFHLNMFFLASRAQQLLSAAARAAPVVFDRSLYEDEIYARIAHEAGHTTADEFNMFQQLADALTQALPRPRVLIYLEASTSCLLERISTRGRAFERGISKLDMELLQVRYRDWIEQYRLSPVLRVDAQHLNLTDEDSGLRDIVDAVRAVF